MLFFSWQTCHNSGLKDLQESSKDPSESVFGVEKTGEASLWNYFTNTNLTVQRMKKSSKDPSESVLYMEKKAGEASLWNYFTNTVFGTITIGCHWCVLLHKRDSVLKRQAEMVQAKKARPLSPHQDEESAACSRPPHGARHPARWTPTQLSQPWFAAPAEHRSSRPSSICMPCVDQGVSKDLLHEPFSTGVQAIQSFSADLPASPIRPVRHAVPDHGT